MSNDYVPFDTDGLPAVSVSKIEMFVKCPLSYKLAYIDHVRGDQTPEQNFGVAVHGCMESVFRWVLREEFVGRIPDELVLASFRESFFKHVESAETGLYNDGLKMVRRYVRGLDDVDYRNLIGIERRFVLKLGSFAVVGVMDRVDRDGDDGIVVSDYKTNKNLYAEEELEDSLQASVYLLVAKKLWPWVKKLSFRFEMLRHDVSQPVVRVVDDLLAIEQYLVGVYQKMTQQKTFDAKPSFFCPWCGQKRKCSFYQDLMRVPLMDREPIVADPDADLEFLSVEREKCAAAESIARREKNKFDSIIKRFIRDSADGSLKVNGKLYKVFSKESIEYEVVPTMDILKKYIGKDPTMGEFLSVDDAKLRALVEEKLPLRSQRALVMAELGACSKKVKTSTEYVNSSSIAGGRRAKKNS